MHLRDFFTDLLTEKAVSKQQQKFFGVVRSMQKGDTPKSGEAGEVAKDMKVSDVKDFAKTKHKGLPKKAVKEEMIGSPDAYYDEEERRQAFDDLQDALQGNYMDDYIKDGACPACGGNGYMDGEEEVYNDETEEYEEGTECDGFGNYGCDEGEMTYGSDGPSWVEIIKHDKRNAERQKSKADYPGDEEVVKKVAAYMKRMDDPRMAFQQMKIDYPHMGKGQRSGLLAKAKQMAFGESITEGEERQIIHRATVDNLVDQFENKVNDYDTLVDLHDAIYNELSYLDMEDIGMEGVEDAGQPLMDFHNGRVLDVLDSYGVIDDVVARLDLSDLDESLTEEDNEEKEALQMYKYLHNKHVKSGQRMEFDLPMLFKDEMPKVSDKKRREYYMKFLNQKDESVSEDKEADSNEAMVAKMLAKALGDENRWTEMSPYELYSELESERPQDADVIALAAKMLYDIKLKESNRVEEDKDMFNQLRIDDNTNITDGNKELTPAEVDSGFYLLGFDRDGRCFEMNKISKERAKDSITGYGEYKVSDADITDFDGARYYYNENMPDSGVLNIKQAANEAEYQGRKVKLGKPTRGDVKKFKVYVKDPKTGNVKKVNFGHGGTSAKKAGQKTMKIKKSNPARRKSFRARHNCDNPGPRTKARYWSCRAW